jgi:hypothetical protein
MVQSCSAGERRDLDSQSALGRDRLRERCSVSASRLTAGHRACLLWTPATRDSGRHTYPEVSHDDAHGRGDGADAPRDL